jgi:hypothetical protein
MWYWHYFRAQEIATERSNEADRNRLGRLAKAHRGRRPATTNRPATVERRNPSIG